MSAKEAKISAAFLLALTSPVYEEEKMTLKKHMRFFTFAALVVTLLSSGCATQPQIDAYDPPGFFSGFLHGLLIVFSFIASLFTDVRIYAYPNSGGWYDFGYLIGASAILRSGSITMRSKE